MFNTQSKQSTHGIGKKPSDLVRCVFGGLILQRVLWSLYTITRTAAVSLWGSQNAHRIPLPWKKSCSTKKELVTRRQFGTFYIFFYENIQDTLRVRCCYSHKIRQQRLSLSLSFSFQLFLQSDNIMRLPSQTVLSDCRTNVYRLFTQFRTAEWLMNTNVTYMFNRSNSMNGFYC